MERRLRKAEWIAVAVVLAVILTIVFWPTPVDRPYDKGLASVLATLHAGGLPVWIDYNFIQTGSNVIMFVPLGALIASVSMRPLWWISGVLGLTLSLCIEFTQYELLPQRFASAGDLAANTAGALLGGAIIAVARAARASKRTYADRHGGTSESD
jgi:glycopeptide antibiotics resistance protein